MSKFRIGDKVKLSPYYYVKILGQSKNEEVRRVRGTIRDNILPNDEDYAVFWDLASVSNPDNLSHIFNGYPSVWHEDYLEPATCEVPEDPVEIDNIEMK